jgi:hypothetical protein
MSVLKLQYARKAFNFSFTYELTIELTIDVRFRSFWGFKLCHFKFLCYINIECGGNVRFET